MSPEQAAGDVVDQRSDVYALGCLTYEMLAGEPPFTGRNVQAIVQQHIAAPPPLVSNVRATVSQEISSAIQRALAKIPADRFTTATEYVQALSRAAVDTAMSWSDLVRRRVPHVLAAYVVAAALVALGLDVAVNRFVLSPHLPMFGLVALATLLPAVAIIAYRRGSETKGLSKAVTFGIPTNVFASVVILWLAFGSKDLGAATTSVVVEDEDGNTIERTVPKSAFRKRFALFYFDNESGDTTANWLQYGLPILLAIDLTQDMFVQVLSPQLLQEDFKKAGYDDGVQLPLTLQRQLTDEQHYPYFVSGNIARNEGELAVTVSLHETRRGKLIAENTVAGSDLFDVVDQIAVQLKRDLDLPTAHIEEAEDLPIADIMTASIDSYRHFIRAFEALVFEESWQNATKWLEASVEADPTNAFSQLQMYVVSLFGNDPQRAGIALESALQHSYKMPERVRFQVKMAYYEFNQQPEKQLAVAKLQVELFPDDIDARTVLAMMYLIRDDKDAQTEQYEAILDLDPTRYEFLKRLGTVAREKGDFERAAAYYEQYAEHYPDDDESYTALAGLARLQGAHQRAQELYDRALLIDPANVGVLVSVAVHERHFDNLEREIPSLEQALQRSKTGGDTVRVLNALQNAYSWRGQMGTAIEYMQRRWEIQQRTTPQALMLINQMGSLDEFAKAGQVDTARQILEAVRSQLGPPWNQFVPFGDLTIALELEDVAAAEAAIPPLQAFIDALGLNLLDGEVLHAHGRVAEMKGDYGEALEWYEREFEKDPTDATVSATIGRTHRKQGNLDEAELYLRAALMQHPHHPSYHYELALVFADRGDTAQAIELLEAALAVWANADPRFKRAQEARAKLQELRPAA